jgi:DNA-binding MarR family transcriptional regulator
LFFAAGWSTVVAADKGKPIERWGRKASGLRTHVYDSGVAMSADIQSALIDVALWLYHAFFVPGDRLLSKFPALDVAGHGRVMSGLLSAVIWLGAIVLIVGICRFIRDLDRALAALVVRVYEELRQVWQIVARRLTSAFRSYALKRRARLARTEVFEQPALTALQLQILQSHAGLPPAHLLTPSDIAHDLDMCSADIEEVLANLRKLSLVERTLGAGGGEDGYRLTRPGEVLLAACSRAQPAKGTSLPQQALRPKRIEPMLGSV